MSKRIFIEVKDNLTKERFVSACNLPVQIGKKPNVGNTILLDAKYRTISRIHGFIKEDTKGFVYYDQSANGSYVNEHFVHNQKVRFDKDDLLKIENYHIRLIKADPLTIFQTDQRLSKISEKHLLPGKGFAIRQDGDKIQLVDLNLYSGDDRRDIVRLYMRDDKIHCEVNPSYKSEIILNKSPQSKGKIVLNPFDVLEIDKFRFEILRPGEPKLVCGNTTCHLLNPLSYEENCRWCGRHLTAAGGQTRIIT